MAQRRGENGLDHGFISWVPAAQHAIFVLKVESSLSAELSDVDRLAEVIKFLFLHDFLFRQRCRQYFTLLWSASWLALLHKSLCIEKQIVGVVDFGFLAQECD